MHEVANNYDNASGRRARTLEQPREPLSSVLCSVVTSATISLIPVCSPSVCFTLFSRNLRPFHGLLGCVAKISVNDTSCSLGRTSEYNAQKDTHRHAAKLPRYAFILFTRTPIQFRPNRKEKCCSRSAVSFYKCASS